MSQLTITTLSVPKDLGRKIRVEAAKQGIGVAVYIQKMFEKMTENGWNRK